VGERLPLRRPRGPVPYQATIDWLNECVPDATARAKIFGETARKLYFNGQ